MPILRLTAKDGVVLCTKLGKVPPMFLALAWGSRYRVPCQVLPVEWAGVSCYLSHSLQKHTSHGKIKHSPHFVTSSSSFSPLCSPSVLPVFYQFKFCLTTCMWNAKSEYEHYTSNSVTEKFLRSIGSVSRIIHLECRVACIHTLFIFLLLQNLEEPARD